MNEKSKKMRVVIVGAGPAGLSASIAAGEKGDDVILLESQPVIGRKLCASGNGRCNFTNALAANDFMKRFGHFGRFLSDALNIASSSDFLDFLKQHGIIPVNEDGFHFFPASGKASDVRNAMLSAAKFAGVKIQENTTVKKLMVEQGRITGVETDKETLSADKVILACGSNASPQLGGTASGFELAKSVGHTVRPSFPALSPLFPQESWFHSLAGVSLKQVQLTLKGKGHVQSFSQTGDLLFTHTGISGPVVLDISAAVSRAVQENKIANLQLKVCPQKSEETWYSELLRMKEHMGNAMLRNCSPRKIPESFWKTICLQAIGEDNTKMNLLPNAKLRKLAILLTSIPLTVTNIPSMERAMVCDGGVSVREINPKTMESKLIHGLFFAGEIIDLTGACGGFHIQMAWSTGRLSGLS